MKKIIFILLMIFLWFSLTLESKKLGTLPDLMKPESITVQENDLYVVEGAAIHVYSIADLKLRRTFGKQGQGPGELTVGPGYSNKITLFKDHLVAECRNKLIYFSKDGKFQKEIRKGSFTIIQSIPVGKNFAVSKLTPAENGQRMYHSVCLFDSSMKEIKELYRMKFMQQGQPPKAELNMLFDSPGFRIYDNKIFVEESAGGFIIDVFDENGNKLYRIEKEFEKKKITDSYKESLIDQLKDDAVVKALGDWDSFRKLFTLHFPDTFPAIRNIEVSDNRIYVQTYNQKDNREECLIMDLRGKILKRVFLPKFKNFSVVGSILGTKLDAIQNDVMYYLSENGDTEEWELHQINLQ
jgi:hypothetical protein